MKKIIVLVLVALAMCAVYADYNMTVRTGFGGDLVEGVWGLGWNLDGVMHVQSVGDLSLDVILGCDAGFFYDFNIVLCEASFGLGMTFDGGRLDYSLFGAYVNAMSSVSTDNTAVMGFMVGGLVNAEIRNGVGVFFGAKWMPTFRELKLQAGGSIFVDGGMR